MRRFLARLQQLNPPRGGRRWLYLPYDQLSDQFGPLAQDPAAELAIVLIENPAKAARRPYHRQKLAWILTQQRQFALEQAARGVHVVYRVGDYAEVLEALQEPLEMQEAAEWELRQQLRPLVERGQLRILPHEGWLTTREQFEAGPCRMDAFYRRVRQDSGILMERGKPAGGKYSHDAENRQTWRGQPPAPQPPGYAMDDLRAEVKELIEERYAHHPGQLDLTTIPLSLEQIQGYWRWVQRHCLPWFGPYEDAMSSESSGLFHSRLSPLIHLHRITPRQVVNETLALDLPLASQEGFVRQILGWREFVHHVHVQTQGFRSLSPLTEGAADPSFLEARRPLPPVYWGKPSGLHCLDRSVADVWRDGWGHHIARLMVLSNLATLLDISPRQLCDWFWVAYIDAFDWVVEPNVLAMGTYGVGPLMTTKPYVSGSAYIDKMSDYCSQCRFDPKKNCPITPLYWAFLGRQRQRLADNPRMGVVLRAWDKRDPDKKAGDQATFERVSQALGRGQELSP